MLTPKSTEGGFSFPIERWSILAAQLVVVATALSFYVRQEPAPCDILYGLATIVGLPALVRGLRALGPILVAAVAVLVLTTFVGVFTAPLHSGTVRFAGVTLYLIAVWAETVGLQRARLSAARLLPNGFEDGIYSAYFIAAAVTGIMIWIEFLAMIVGREGLVHSLLRFGRPMAFFKDPNVAGSFLVPPTILAASRVLKGSGQERPRLGWPRYLFLLSATFYTGSRSAVLSLALGYVLLLLLSTSVALRLRAKHILATAVMVLLVLPLIATSSQQAYAVGSRVLPTASALQAVIGDRLAVASFKPDMVYSYDEGRLAAWRAAVHLWQVKPLLGIGTGAFGNAVQAQNNGSQSIPIATSPHNTYLMLLSENGLLGLSAFLVAVAVTSFAIFRRGIYRSQPWLAASYLALLANIFLIDGLHFRHLWIIWALLISAQRGETSVIAGAYCHQT